MPPKNLLTASCLLLFFNAFSQTKILDGVLPPPNHHIGEHNTTISGLRITTGLENGSLVIDGCNNIIIKNCIIGPTAGEGITIQNSSNITVENCFFFDNRTGVYVTNSDGIKVNNNQFCNIHGPFPRGQLVQFSGVSGAGNEINYNVAENVPDNSSPIDLVNLYQSSGTASSPIYVNGNKFRGGGPDIHSGGILLGDDGGAYEIAQDNILVDPGQYGMAIASGHDNQLLNNKIYGRRQSFTNTGIYAYNIYLSHTCNNLTVAGNEVNYTNKTGQSGNEGYWGQPSENNMCGTINGLPTNNWNAGFGAEILDRLLNPVLMAYYPFNGNWTDVSGSALNASTAGVGFSNDGDNFSSAVFNGTGYVEMPASPWFKITSNRLTVSCWIKPSVIQGIQAITHSQDGDGYSSGWRMLLLDNTLNCRMVTTAGATDVYCGGIQQGVWNYITMTYNGSYLNVYLNGVLQSTAALGGNILYGAASNMQIGRSDGDNYHFNGLVDEFKFYNGDMNDSEILQDYNASVTKINSPRTLLAYYKFNNSWADNSGNRLAVSNNGAAFVCDGADAISAAFGGNAYVVVPSSPLLKTASSKLTLSCWIKPSIVQGIQAIAHSEDGDGYNYGWRMLLIDNTLNGRIITSWGATDVYCGGIQAGVWNHVVMVYDGNQLMLYLNGVLQGSAASGGYILYSTAANMRIGLSNGANYYFNGHIDEFKFYNGSITASDVLQDYNETLQLINNPPACPLRRITEQQIAVADNGTFNEGYSILPNPAIDRITIKSGTTFNAALYSSTGAFITSGKSAGGELTLNIKGLAAGIYYLHIVNGNKSTTKKIMVKR